MRVVAGIDVGGTNTFFGLIDREGKILFRDVVPTTDFPDPRGLVNEISNRITELQPPDSELIGIGMSILTSSFRSIVRSLTSRF